MTPAVRDALAGQLARRAGRDARIRCGHAHADFVLYAWHRAVAFYRDAQASRIAFDDDAPAPVHAVAPRFGFAVVFDAIAARDAGARARQRDERAFIGGTREVL